MAFRFRKSFDIIPGLLRWTISKRGASLNLHLGIYSKSWGSGGRRTRTIDIPGTSGIFFRKQTRVKEDPDDPDEGFSHLVQLLLIIGTALISYGRVRFEGHSSGHPYILVTLIFGVGFGALWLLWRQWDILRGFLGILLALVIVYLQWKATGAWVIH